MRHLPLLLILSTLTLPLRAEVVQAENAPVTFRNDAMAVLARAGCSAGACHGNKNGKGGLKLSLRGQDPDADFASLTREFSGRRVNLIEPEQSLILLKPTGQIAHEGGVRFKTDSDEYRILKNWIEAGAGRNASTVPTLVKLDVTPARHVMVSPENQVRLKAMAEFSDGTRRDVTQLAVFEQSTDMARIAPDGLVTGGRTGETTVIVRYLQLQRPVRLAFVPAHPDFEWKPSIAASNYIDEQILAKLKLMRMNPSPASTDGEFVRRAFLDVLGILPTAEEARVFVADASAGKRAKLIDALLERPEYADHWALKWSDLLKNEERTLDRKGVETFHKWIRDSVAANKPLDVFVRELLTGRGSTYENPPANYYRANRDPVTRGEATAQLFLGIRLQCAQCHNHPFDRWTQDDYYGWADVFARVDYKIVENKRGDKNDSHEFVGEQIVLENPTGDMKDPRGDRQVKAKLLGGKSISDQTSRLDALASWVTAPANPYFAKAQANRIWYHLMGRGLVDPIDDFRPTNPASHPELLDALAKDFAAHGYDVKHLIRTIMTSAAYGLSSEPTGENDGDESNYSHTIARRLTAEQLLDAQYGVAGVTAEFATYPKGMRAGQLPGVRTTNRRGPKATSADVFLTTFGKPARQLVCECERSGETTLGQTFQLISGPGMGQLLADDKNRISQWLASEVTDEYIVEELYWSALSRAPTSVEERRLIEHMEKAKDRRKALEDVVWAVLNAKEFVLRR